jgi:hypothetical protein
MIRAEHRTPSSSLAPASLSPAQDDGGFGHLFKLGLWGGAAAACLLLVALATRTDTGQARLAAAYAALTGTAETPQQQSAAREREREDARRMTAMIRNLTDDRDRLLARMTALERNYEDVTGSIGKLANAPSPPPSDAAVSAPTQAPVASPPAPSPAPAAVVASIAPEPQGPVSTKAEFGIDIGGGPTLVALRTAWDRASRNHGALLDGLRPLVAVRDGRAGQVELRLVIGPIGNAAAAARLCAALAGAGASCQPTMFEGQRLALR